MSVEIKTGCCELHDLSRFSGLLLFHVIDARVEVLPCNYLRASVFSH